MIFLAIMIALMLITSASRAEYRKYQVKKGYSAAQRNALTRHWLKRRMQSPLFLSLILCIIFVSIPLMTILFMSNTFMDITTSVPWGVAIIVAILLSFDAGAVVWVFGLLWPIAIANGIQKSRIHKKIAGRLCFR